MIERSIALFALFTMVAVVGACGGGHGHSVASSSSVTASRQALETPMVSTVAKIERVRGDEDDDERRKAKIASASEGGTVVGRASNIANKRYYDRDDYRLRRFGHAPSPREKRAIGRLVRSYYAAAAREDGATGCALTSVLRAESLFEDYAPTFVPGATTCPPVLAVLFRRAHASLTTPIHVVEIRVRGRHALILLGSIEMRAAVTSAKLERGEWKIDRVLADPLP